MGDMVAHAMNEMAAAHAMSDVHASIEAAHGRRRHTHTQEQHMRDAHKQHMRTTHVQVGTCAAHDSGRRTSTGKHRSST